MSGAFSYRPKFIDIRVRPPKAGEEEEARVQKEDVLRLKPGEKKCDWPECRVAGAAKAPKSRDLLNEHYWFCTSHAAEYNRNWDFFAGMSEAEVAKAQAARFTGDRPTWEFKASRNSREAASFSAKAGTGAGYADPHGVFGAARTRAPTSAEEERYRRIGKLERKALSELDVDDTAEPPAVRAKYLELVKRLHPDTNGGDRTMEAKLQRVLKAYKTLKAAKLAL
jgi:hypothetical protein